MTVCRGGAEKSGRRPVTAPAAAQPLVELERARLLEEVDDGLAVTSENEGRARVCEGAGRSDPVAQVALCCRTHAHDRLATSNEPDVDVGEMSRVDRGGSGPECSLLVEELRRCTPVAR